MDHTDAALWDTKVMKFFRLAGGGTNTSLTSLLSLSASI
jgi:hypothetical protein